MAPVKKSIPKNAPGVKEKPISLVVEPKVQTAEGWKRMMARTHKSSKKSSR